MILPIRCYALIANGVSGTCNWTLADDGALTVTPESGDKGELIGWTANSRPWSDYCSQVTSVKFNGTIYTKQCKGMFSECTNVKTIDLGNIMTDGCTSMAKMFYNCCSLEQLDASALMTDEVTDMNSMFANCKSLKSLDLSTFDVWQVTDMERMFMNCESLESIDVARWFTYNVQVMDYMFYNCKKLTYIDIYYWDMRNVSDMTSMFEGCENLKAIKMRYFALDRAVSWINTFKNCHSLEGLNLTAIRMSDSQVDYGYFEGTFTGCDNLKYFYNINDNPESWPINKYLFKSLPDKDAVTLYVPAGAVDKYKNEEGWGEFSVSSFDDMPSEEKAQTGITNISYTHQDQAIYSINGIRKSSIQSGLNIINGKKYLVK